MTTPDPSDRSDAELQKNFPVPGDYVEFVVSIWSFTDSLQHFKDYLSNSLKWSELSPRVLVGERAIALVVATCFVYTKPGSADHRHHITQVLHEGTLKMVIQKYSLDATPLIRVVNLENRKEIRESNSEKK